MLTENTLKEYIKSIDWEISYITDKIIALNNYGLILGEESYQELVEHIGYRNTIQRYVENKDILTEKEILAILRFYSIDIPDVPDYIIEPLGGSVVINTFIKGLERYNVVINTFIEEIGKYNVVINTYMPKIAKGSIVINSHVIRILQSNIVINTFSEKLTIENIVINTHKIVPKTIGIVINTYEGTDTDSELFPNMGSNY